jgi:hypothetical protein
MVAVVDQRVVHLVEIAPGGVIVGRPTRLVRSLFSRVVVSQPHAVLPFPLGRSSNRKRPNWRAEEQLHGTTDTNPRLVR